MAISAHLKKIREKVGTELLHMASVTGVVRDEAGRFLLVRHRDSGPWNFPGGIVDPGECPAEAVLREVWEETGVIIEPVRIIGVFGGPEGFRRTYPNGDQVEFIDTVFECRPTAGTLGCRDGETVEVRYFERSEISGITLVYPIPFAKLFADVSKPSFKWDPGWVRSLVE